MSGEGSSNKRARDGDAAKSIESKAGSWAEEFGGLKEDDQYAYLQALAVKMNGMHLQFLRGMPNLAEEDDDLEEEYDDEDDEESEDDGEEAAGDDDE